MSDEHKKEPDSEPILYRSEDGWIRIEIRLHKGMILLCKEVWYRG